MNTDLEVRQPDSPEIQPTAMGAGATMDIQAQMAWAVRFPRNEEVALAAMLKRAENERFANSAVYELERKNYSTGDIKIIRGLSVDIARDMLTRWKNVRIQDRIVADTDEYLIAQVSAWDVEANIVIPEEFIVRKVKERKFVGKGDEVISERTNSKGQTVYVVRLQELELNNAYKAIRARSLRNVINALIPSDIKDEIFDACLRTKMRAAREAVSDPKAIQALKDAFEGIGVTGEDLERYLGHTIDLLNADEYSHMRGVYTSLKKEGLTWDRILEMAGKGPDARPEPEVGHINLSDLQAPPEQPEERTHPDDDGPQQVNLVDEAVDNQTRLKAIDLTIVDHVNPALKKLGVDGRSYGRASRVLAGLLGAERLQDIPYSQIDKIKTYANGAGFRMALEEQGLIQAQT